MWGSRRRRVSSHGMDSASPRLQRQITVSCYRSRPEEDSIINRQYISDGDWTASPDLRDSWRETRSNSVSERYESFSEECGNCYNTRKLKNFIRKLKKEGRRIYSRKPPKLNYDALSYAQNFDEAN
eukprot:Gb_19889 [translate_table: standard]